MPRFSRHAVAVHKQKRAHARADERFRDKGAHAAHAEHGHTRAIQFFHRFLADQAHGSVLPTHIYRLRIR